jgi:hypothetical protein
VALNSFTGGKHSASNSRMVLASIAPSLCNPFAVRCTASKIFLAIVLYLDELPSINRPGQRVIGQQLTGCPFSETSRLEGLH